MTGDGHGSTLGTNGGDAGAPSHVKRSFSHLGVGTGDAERAAPRALPSPNGAQSASLRANPVVLPVIPSAYGDDDLLKDLPTAFIGDAVT